MKGLPTGKHWVWLGTIATVGLFVIYFILTTLAYNFIIHDPQVSGPVDNDDETEADVSKAPFPTACFLWPLEVHTSDDDYY